MSIVVVVVWKPLARVFSSLIHVAQHCWKSAVDNFRLSEAVAAPWFVDRRVMLVEMASSWKMSSWNDWGFHDRRCWVISNGAVRSATGTLPDSGSEILVHPNAPARHRDFRSPNCWEISSYQRSHLIALQWRIQKILWKFRSIKVDDILNSGAQAQSCKFSWFLLSWAELSLADWKFGWAERSWAGLISNFAELSGAELDRLKFFRSWAELIILELQRIVELSWAELDLIWKIRSWAELSLSAQLAQLRKFATL